MRSPTLPQTSGSAFIFERATRNTSVYQQQDRYVQGFQLTRQLDHPRATDTHAIENQAHGAALLTVEDAVPIAVERPTNQFRHQRPLPVFDRLHIDSGKISCPQFQGLPP